MNTKLFFWGGSAWDDEIDLGGNCEWINEFDYPLKTQNIQISVDGEIIISSFQNTTYRKVTLDCSWQNRAMVVSLESKFKSSTQFRLETGAGIRMGVAVDTETSPIDAAPLLALADNDNEDKYTLTLHLIKISGAW